MAKNTRKGYREGPINDRYQENHNGVWFKYDNDDNFKGAKQGTPFKGVRKR